MKSTGINALARDIHKNAVEHGWWEEKRSLPEIIALIHSELSEALEEYRSGKPLFYYVVEMDNGEGGTYPAIRTDILSRDDFKGEKPEGIAVELADCIIRILDYCAWRKIDIEEALNLRKAGNDTYTLPELIAECHYLIAQAHKCEEPRSLYFAECISLIKFWCNENAADIDEVIMIKHEYNKTRTYRHGGKKC